MENSFCDSNNSLLNTSSMLRYPRRPLGESKGSSGNQSHGSNLSLCQGDTSSKGSTPSRSRSSTPSRRTPSRKQSSGKKQGGATGGNLSHDRFIPNRQTSNFELGHYRHCVETELPEDPDERRTIEQKRELMFGAQQNSRIFSFGQEKAPVPEGLNNRMQILFSTCKTKGSTVKAQRHIAKTPERILDAPDIVNDYYLNLLSWSSSNLVAIALSTSLYIWDPVEGDTTLLANQAGSTDAFTSVKWAADGNTLALGTNDGSVQLWDVSRTQRLRVMRGHEGRVPSLSWNGHIVSSGHASGAVHNHDVRVADHHVGTMSAHTMEVCGLEWSSDGRFLASGGNDNLLHIWGHSAGLSGATPIHVFSQHQAAVKAVSWCPWQTTVLASGGGTNDRHIRLWQVSSGTATNAVDTGSQVCGIKWNVAHHELISGHGFAQNQLTIWKYPSMERVTDLIGHTERVLYMDISPDEQFVMSASADETLRLWKCFAIDAKKKTASKSGSTSGSLGLFNNMR